MTILPNRRGPARITIRTVAEDAGVSVAAVSKVLRNAYGVSDVLRGKVEASIARLGYRPSIAARAMRGKTYTVGVLLVTIDNPFLPAVVSGINATLGDAGYKVLIATGEAKRPIETSMIDSMIDLSMDGVILVAPQIAHQTLESFARKIPIVVIGHHEADARGFDTINSDDRAGARMSTEALIADGRRRIAMISLRDSGDSDTDVAPMREKGYLAALAAVGLAPRIIRLPNNVADRMEELRPVLTSPDRPDALFCWSDLDAVPALALAREIGLRVPEDLALVGYDNSPVAALPLVNLTSMDQHGKTLGELGAKRLLTRLGGRASAEHVLVPPDLVRRSTG